MPGKHVRSYKMTQTTSKRVPRIIEKKTISMSPCNADGSARVIHGHGDVKTFDIDIHFDGDSVTHYINIPRDPTSGGARAQSNREPDLNALPFALPKTEKDHEKVNEVLEYSIGQQKEFEITDDTGFVILVVHRCLQALNIKSSIAFGYREVSGPAKLPQMWLKIREKHLDNTYWRQACKSSFLYLQDNYPRCYQEVVYRNEKNPPKPKKQAAKKTPDHENRKRRIEFCAEYPDHALALCLNREKSYNFYFTMIKHMFNVYKVTIQGINPEVRYQCWRCFEFPKSSRWFLSSFIFPQSEDSDSEGEEPVPPQTAEPPAAATNDVSSTTSSSAWKFKQCPRCMVANYCSPKCQEEDWGLHRVVCQPKVLACESGDNPFSFNH